MLDSLYFNSVECNLYKAKDRSKNSLVISIRGTMSRHDIVTDIKSDATNIGNGVEGRGHTGMIQCASQILLELDEQNIFDNHLAETPNIVVTGHSLGAGVAVILALILKTRYSNVKCFAYSLPGGLLCPKANQVAKEICTSVVVGKDMIPRLGLRKIVFH